MSASLTNGCALSDDPQNFEAQTDQETILMNSSVVDNMENRHKRCAIRFIEDIWNNNKLEMLDNYLHPNFIDHSLPVGFQNVSGLSSYLLELRKSIKHMTAIEKIETEQEYVFLKVIITLNALPNPENTRFRGKQSEKMHGYRILSISEGKITAHWEIF